MGLEQLEPTRLDGWAKNFILVDAVCLGSLMRSNHFRLDLAIAGAKVRCSLSRLRIDLRLMENSLAYVEMRLILVRLIWGYDLTLVDDVSRQFLECKAFSLWMKGPLNVCLTPVARE